MPVYNYRDHTVVIAGEFSLINQGSVLISVVLEFKCRGTARRSMIKLHSEKSLAAPLERNYMDHEIS
jgi:hypothetical protein